MTKAAAVPSSRGESSREPSLRPEAPKGQLMAGTGEPQGSHRGATEPAGHSAVLTRAPPLGLAGAHVASLLDEAAAGSCALRALPAGPELLERRRCSRLIDVTTVGAQPLSRPVAHLLELLRRATHA